MQIFLIITGIWQKDSDEIIKNIESGSKKKEVKIA